MNNNNILSCGICKNNQSGMCHAPKYQYVPEWWTIPVSIGFARSQETLCGKNAKFIRIDQIKQEMIGFGMELKKTGAV